MSTGNTKPQLLVRSQLPEFVANDYPKFVEFLKAYYTFVNNNYNINVEDLRDADNTSSALLVFLRRELMKNFPTAVINERKLINTIRELYNRKGNLDSIKLLFKLFFNDSVIIYQPGNRILKASDGKWFQYNMIVLSQIDWEKVSADILRAAVGVEPYATLFNTVVDGYKVGDINRSGSVTSADALAVSKFSMYPQNTTQTQRTHIEDVLIPTLQNNSLFSEYIFSNIDLNDIIPNVSRLVIENKFGRFTPTVEIVEVEANKKIRLFYKTYTNLKVETGQIIRVTGQDGSIVFTGKHTKAPSGLKIVNPGKDWQKGQVINIPGSVKDTIARVLEVGTQGELLKLEILEYGFTHDENLSVIISPYPIKPSSNAAYDVSTTITGIDAVTKVPNQFSHVLTLNDYTEGTTETLYGEGSSIVYNVLVSELLNAANDIEPAKTLFDIVVSGFKIGDINHSGSVTQADSRIASLYITNPTSIQTSYRDHIEDILIPKLKDLIENINPASPPAYTGILYSIISPFAPSISGSTTETTSVKYNFSELTFDEWVASRATLAFESSDIVKTKGYYLNDESIVSNNEARLQDNYFFQLFSYMIETTKDASEVSNILNQFHPAGMKYFFQKNKKNFYSIRDLVESYRAISNDVVFAREVTSNLDVIAKDVTRVMPRDEAPEEDFVYDFIEALDKIVIKPIIEPDVTVSDAWSEFQDPIKFVFKPIFEEVQATNVPIKDFIKNKEAERGDEFIASTTATPKTSEKIAVPDEFLSADLDPIKLFTKVSVDADNFAVDADPIKDFTKVSVDPDNYAVDADPIKDFTKVSTETIPPTDAAPILATVKEAVADTILPDDSSTNKNLTKYTEQDTALLNDGSLISVTALEYAAEDYYITNQGANNFSQIAITAEIG